MFLLAVVSCNGGTGRTTLTANLATLVARRGQEVLALDLDPRNALGMHFALPLAEADGWAARAGAGEGWHQAAFQNADQVRLLPFGRVPHATAASLESALAGQPGWLLAQLDTLDLAPHTLVLIDTPRLPSALAAQALHAADAVLNVMIPDANSYASLGQLPALHGKRLAHVINQMDATRALHSHLLQLLHRDLREQMSPAPIHHDLAVPEAVAGNLCLIDHSPHCQAAHDFQGLAQWVLQLARDSSHSEARHAA